MATGILSTKTGGILTAQQHSAQMVKSGIDFCLLDFGGNFSHTTSGLTLNVSSGMGQCYGRTFQFTSGSQYTITANRNFRLIVRVNLATGTANTLVEEYVGSIPGKTFSSNLIDNLLGTHDIEIGRGTSTGNSLTFTKTITTYNYLRRYTDEKITDLGNELQSYVLEQVNPLEIGLENLNLDLNSRFQTPKVTLDDGSALYTNAYTLTKTLSQTLNGMEMGYSTVEMAGNSPSSPTDTAGIAVIHKWKPNSTTNTNGICTGTFTDIVGRVYTLANAFGTNTPYWQHVQRTTSYTITNNNNRNAINVPANALIDIEIAIPSQTNASKFRVEFHSDTAVIPTNKQSFKVTGAAPSVLQINNKLDFDAPSTTIAKMKIYGRTNGSVCFTYSSGDHDGYVESGWIHNMNAIKSIRVVGINNNVETTINHTTQVRVDF